MGVKFSIVTICLNEETKIRKTMKSVYSQTYQDYEHIIIDGKSTDKTLEYISDCEKFYIAGALRVYSEVDKGIYDAMNKGIHRVAGEFICFMNGGDEFYDENVLEKVAKEINANRGYDIYYGDAVMVYPNGRERNQFRNYKWELNKGDSFRSKGVLMPCHQAIFASRKCFINNMFDLNYRLRAELKWFVNCNLNNITMRNTGLLICKYLYGGTSAQVKNYILSDYEKKKLVEGDIFFELEEKTGGYDFGAIRNKCLVLMLDKWLALKQEGRKFDSFFSKLGYSRIAIYGYGVLGNHLVTELEGSKTEVAYLIDREKKHAYSGVPVYSMEDSLESVDVIVVTVALHFDTIVNELKKKVQSPIIALDDILEELWYV